MFWVVFIACISLILVAILIFDHKQRSVFFAEVGLERTIIKNSDGHTLFALSNQIVVRKVRNSEVIIAVGKQGETGFDKNQELPSDAVIIDLTEPLLFNEKRGKLFWQRYFNYCRALALSCTIGTDKAFSRKLSSTRLFVDIENAPNQLNAILSKSISGFHLSSPLISPKRPAP